MKKATKRRYLTQKKFDRYFDQLHYHLHVFVSCNLESLMGSGSKASKREHRRGLRDLEQDLTSMLSKLQAG